MEETNIHAADTFTPRFSNADCDYIITSDPESHFSRDAFETLDGRLITVTGAGTASMMRLQFGVTVAYSARWNCARNRSLTGSAGTMYLTEAGSWELYPYERVTTSYNRAVQPTGIHCSVAANRRAAALLLVALSDDASKSVFDYVAESQGLRVGAHWRIKPLGVRPGDPCPTRPRPLEIPVRCHTQRIFLATRHHPARPMVTVRVVVEAWDYGRGVNLRGFVSAMEGDSLDSMGGVPRSVINACVSRCYAS